MTDMNVSGLRSRAREGLGAVVLLISGLVSAPSAFADLIVNGSFELPVVPVGSYADFTTGSTLIDGWTVLGSDVAVSSTSFVQSGIAFQAQSGVQWLDLSGITSNSTANGVTQSIATVAGSLYRVSFHVGSATDGSLFFPSTVDLQIDAGSRTHYLNPAAPSQLLNWAPFTADFTAAGPSTRLTFFDGGVASNYNSALDNVSVVAVAAAVPEPSELALLSLGLGMLSLVARRRRAS